MSKIREGFVSNSSSSSFILTLDKKPQTKEELQTLLFGDAAYYYDPYYDPDCDYFSKRTEKYETSFVAETVFADLKDQKPMTIEQISEELDSGWVDGSPDYNDFRKKGSDSNICWDSYEKANKVYTSKLAKKMKEEAKDKEVYVVEYSDDTSYGSALEHGPLFKRISSYRLSKH